MDYSEHFDCTPHKAQDELMVSAEYEAGYQARLQGSEHYRTATPSWRSGWNDADHDLLSGALRKDSQDIKDIDPQWSAFGTGRDARLCELPFDPRSSFNWKRDWVLADIALGMAAKRGRV